MEINNDTSHYDIRPDVLNYDDIRAMAPALDGHPKLVKALLHWLEVDKVNAAHGAVCDTPGAEFVRRLFFDQFHMKMRIDNAEQLDHLPQGAFITVSNHPLGALDGIALIHLIASRRPRYKVMVNMILNKISAMRPNFIAVDPMASTESKRRAQSVQGIRQALRQLHQGEPLGFFPAGAMSKPDWRGHLHDRPWQDSVLQIIHKAKVPVIPIYFHDRNSLLCDIMGHVCWPFRSVMLPHEVFRKLGKTLHISVGPIISVEQQSLHSATAQELGKYLREQTYALRNNPINPAK